MQPEQIISYIIFLLVSYLAGSIPFAQIFASLFSPGTQLKDVGTGNVGTTNVMTTVGILPGILTFFCDVSKGVLMMLLARRYFGLSFQADLYLLLGVSIAVFIGHAYPVFNRFNGGKGLAVLAGFCLFFGPVWFFLANCLALTVLFREDPQHKLAGLNVIMLIIFPVMSLFWILETNLPFSFLSWDFTHLFSENPMDLNPLSWFALIWGLLFFIQRVLGNPGMAEDIKKGISPWKAIGLRGVYEVYPQESDYRHPDADMPMGEELFKRD